MPAHFHSASDATSVTLVLAAVLWSGAIWADDTIHAHVVALFGALVAADDAENHALGVWTPLDPGW